MEQLVSSETIGLLDMKRSTFVIVFAASVIASTGASARDALVSYHDLNLSLPSDQARLDRRVEAAARDVCQTDARPGSNFAAPASLACYGRATTAARADVAAASRADAAARLALLKK
jgi:UrcA family protein